MSSIKLSLQMLKQNDNSPKVGQWMSYPTITFDEARKITAKAFDGNATSDAEPTFQWILEPYRTRADISEHDQFQFLSLLLGFSIHQVLSCNGMVFGQQVDGMLVSAVAIQQYDPSKEKKWIPSMRKKWSNLVAFLKMRRIVPAFLKEDMGKFEQMGNMLEKVYEEWHENFGPKDLHWYVSSVAVDPDCQGKGYGKEIMRKIGELADTNQMSCYLECVGERRMKYYELFGYELTGTVVLDLPEVNSNRKLSVYLMVRSPKRAA